MADITQRYDDQKIVDELKRLRPQINFGDSLKVGGVEVDDKRVLSLTVDYLLTADELESILAASLQEPTTRKGLIL